MVTIARPTVIGAWDDATQYTIIPHKLFCTILQLLIDSLLFRHKRY